MASTTPGGTGGGGGGGGADGDAPAATTPRFSLEVLDWIKTAQAQNGLRHNDYVRYAQYCTRRLDKIRHAKAVSFTHGSGRKYVKRELTAADVTDARHLQLPLVAAERAWAQCQRLKQDVSDGSGNARDRHHPIQRLKKAAGWAGLLERLAAERGDARTALEAQAYACWMRATLAVEQRAWGVGQSNLALATKIYEQLAAVSSRRHQDMYGSRVEEMGQMERFCRYNLAKAARVGGGGATTAAGAAAVEAAGLGDKIAAALAEVRGTGGGGGVDVTVSWRGLHVVVKSDKLRALMSAVATKASQLSLSEGGDGGDDGGASGGGRGGAPVHLASTETAYLELLTRYDECIRVAAAEAARLAKEGKSAMAMDSRAVEDYLKFAKSRFVLDRSGFMIAAAVDTLQAASVMGGAAAATGGGVGAAVPTPTSTGGRRRRAAAGASGSGGGTAPTTASTTATGAAPPPPAPAPLLSASPWLSTLASTQAAVPPTPATGVEGGATASGGGNDPREGSNPAAVAAAYEVVAWYARALRTVDDMVALAGGAPSGEGGMGMPTLLPASAPTDVAPDATLVAILTARRQLFAAWRAYYVATAAIHAKRFSDATVMMHRAQARADTALDLIRTLPAEVKPRDLPAVPLLPTALDEATTVPTAVVLSGLSALDASSAATLLDLVSQQTVALQATALMEQLAPRIRADGTYASAYASTFGPDSAMTGALITSLPKTHGVVRAVAAAPKNLVRDGTVVTTVLERSAQGTALAPLVDVGSVDVWPPRPHPAPFKPILLDLAIKQLPYPDLTTRAPEVFKPTGKGGGSVATTTTTTGAPASTAGAGVGGDAGGGAGADGGSGGGFLSWLTGR